MSTTDRVRRPPGLTIAIISVAILYGVLPLLEVCFLRRLAISADEAYLGGVEITTWTWIEAGVGLVILLICLLAWIGRPSWIRIVLIVAIVIPTLLNLYRIVQAINDPVDPLFGGQVQSAMRNLLLCQLPALVLVPLYTAWYLNRTPARAFYQRVPLSALWSSEHPSGDGQREEPAQTE